LNNNWHFLQATDCGFEASIRYPNLNYPYLTIWLSPNGFGGQRGGWGKMNSKFSAIFDSLAFRKSEIQKLRFDVNSQVSDRINVGKITKMLTFCNTLLYH
jgi:hypothetical protein